MNYEKAKNRIKSRFNAWVLDDEDLEALQTLVPELAENEDERVLNALITHISIYEGDFTTVGVTRLEILDWLEKLKKQEEVRPGLKKANDLRTWLNIVSKVLTEFQGIGQYLDNPICQEIANMLREKYCFDNTSSDWDRVYCKGLDAGEIYGYNKAKKEQQPTEWSEEDEKMRIKIMSLLSSRCSVNEYKEIEDWFKSLSPQPHWKPSEE